MRGGEAGRPRSNSTWAASTSLRAEGASARLESAGSSAFVSALDGLVNSTSEVAWTLDGPYGLTVRDEPASAHRDPRHSSAGARRDRRHSTCAPGRRPGPSVPLPPPLVVLRSAPRPQLLADR